MSSSQNFFFDEIFAPVIR